MTNNIGFGDIYKFLASFRNDAENATWFNHADVDGDNDVTKDEFFDLVKNNWTGNGTPSDDIIEKFWKNMDSRLIHNPSTKPAEEESVVEVDTQPQVNLDNNHWGNFTAIESLKLNESKSFSLKTLLDSSIKYTVVKKTNNTNATMTCTNSQYGDFTINAGNKTGQETFEITLEIDGCIVTKEHTIKFKENAIIDSETLKKGDDVANPLVVDDYEYGSNGVLLSLAGIDTLEGPTMKFISEAIETLSKDSRFNASVLQTVESYVKDYFLQYISLFTQSSSNSTGGITIGLDFSSNGMGSFSVIKPKWKEETDSFYSSSLSVSQTDFIRKDFIIDKILECYNAIVNK